MKAGGGVDASRFPGVSESTRDLSFSPHAGRLDVT